MDAGAYRRCSKKAAQRDGPTPANRRFGSVFSSGPVSAGNGPRARFSALDAEMSTDARTVPKGVFGVKEETGADARRGDLSWQVEESDALLSLVAGCRFLLRQVVSGASGQRSIPAWAGVLCANGLCSPECSGQLASQCAEAGHAAGVRLGFRVLVAEAGERAMWRAGWAVAQAAV